MSTCHSLLNLYIAEQYKQLRQKSGKEKRIHDWFITPYIKFDSRIVDSLDLEMFLSFLPKST